MKKTTTQRKKGNNNSELWTKVQMIQKQLSYTDRRISLKTANSLIITFSKLGLSIQLCQSQNQAPCSILFDPFLLKSILDPKSYFPP